MRIFTKMKVYQKHYRKIVAIMLTLICLLACIQAATAAAKLQGSFGKIKRNTLLLNQPRVDSKIIGEIFKGDSVELLNATDVSDDGQYLLCTLNSKSLVGYIVYNDVEFISKSEFDSIKNTAPIKIASNTLIIATLQVRIKCQSL